MHFFFLYMVVRYEYSFKVTSIKPFIKYCEDNKYKLENTINEERCLYKNGGPVMARITDIGYKKI